ncbi:MAG: DUF3987 domain-containing protein [Methylococcaceae bacterium]
MSAFNPTQSWADDITTKHERIAADTLVMETARQASMAKRSALNEDDAFDIYKAFNAAYHPTDWITTSGYDIRGNKARHPNSKKGGYSAGIYQDEKGIWRIHALSTNDPLYVAGSKSGHDAISTFCTLFHGGDIDAALKDAGDNLLTIGSESFNKAKQRVHEQKKAKEKAQTSSGSQSQTGSSNNSEDLDSETLSHDYPTFDPVGFYGIAGEAAHLASEKSEADPIAVYFSFLVAMAAMLGRHKFIRVGDSKHYARLFAALVGASSRARKGTSFKPVERIIRKIEEIFNKSSIGSMNVLAIANGGLSSAEGLVYAVRDESEQTSGKDDTPLWEGVDDKRLLVVEEELANAFKIAQREGNTLSQVLRRAWDGGTLAPMTKNNRLSATDPHINTLGHITQFELNGVVSKSDIYNGLINRYLWACVRRTKKLSRPQQMDDDAVCNIARRLADALLKSQSSENNEICLDDEALNLWDVQYHVISTDRHGAIGAITSRNEAHVLRLALLFCLLDGVSAITTAHIWAAIHVVNYSTASAEFIFTVPSDESPDAQKLLTALDVKPLSQSAISKVFNGHKSKADLTTLLTDLQTLNKIRKQTPEIGRKVIWEKI